MSLAKEAAASTSARISALLLGAGARAFISATNRIRQACSGSASPKRSVSLCPSCLPGRPKARGLPRPCLKVAGQRGHVVGSNSGRYNFQPHFLGSNEPQNPPVVQWSRKSGVRRNHVGSMASPWRCLRLRLRQADPLPLKREPNEGYIRTGESTRHIIGDSFAIRQNNRHSGIRRGPQLARLLCRAPVVRSSTSPHRFRARRPRPAPRDQRCHS